MENWTPSDDEWLESVLLIFPEALPDRWETIAKMFPGQSPELVRRRYYERVCDMPTETDVGPQIPTTSHVSKEEPPQSGQAKTKKGQWTVEEHSQFLEGLEKCGKGNWKEISENFVRTRTNIQIASHAQKHFKQPKDANNENKRQIRKRKSIFAMTHTQSTNSESFQDHQFCQQAAQDHQFYQQAAPSNHLILPANQSQYNPQNAGNHQYFGSGYPNNDQNLYHQNAWNGQSLVFEDQSLGSESVIANFSHMPQGHIIF